MVNVGNFMAIWYNLWQFGIVCGGMLYFSQFGMLGPKKIWQRWFYPKQTHFFRPNNTTIRLQDVII
jgi:hypothetical protein